MGALSQVTDRVHPLVFCRQKEEASRVPLRPTLARNGPPLPLGRRGEDRGPPGRDAPPPRPLDCRGLDTPGGGRLRVSRRAPSSRARPGTTGPCDVLLRGNWRTEQDYDSDVFFFLGYVYFRSHRLPIYEN